MGRKKYKRVEDWVKSDEYDKQLKMLVILIKEQGYTLGEIKIIMNFKESPLLLEIIAKEFGIDTEKLINYNDFQRVLMGKQSISIKNENDKSIINFLHNKVDEKVNENEPLIISEITEYINNVWNCQFTPYFINYYITRKLEYSFDKRLKIQESREELLRMCLGENENSTNEKLREIADEIIGRISSSVSLEKMARTDFAPPSFANDFIRS